MGILVWRRRTYDREARQPFTGLPLRLPGQWCREKAERLTERAFGRYMVIVLVGSGLATGCLFAPSGHRLSLLGGMLLAAMALAAWMGWSAEKEIREASGYRLGAAGEQVIARELDRLMATGHRVLHDVPFGSWNIDHVVVGPTGIFAVETKTWRKANRRGRPEIAFDGESLRRGGGPPDRRPVEQARRNAASLGKWIAEATAEAVPVVPVLAIPGWFVTIQRSSDVAVYSGKGMSEHLPKRGKARLLPEQIQRIAFQLARRCAADEAPAGRAS
ncbi:MAG TPA: nuclease-related domain-containing protein [Opitutaceae bacterium]|nr:nuclease-related domain-containing protein [Opitutaceae bacterium]